MTARRIAAATCLVATVAAVFLPGRWYLLMWVPFAAGAYLVCRLDRRTALVLVLLGGAALPLAAAIEPPNSSDDMYRYVWDGRVQRAGVDPYRFPPSAPELTGLRDGFLWPDASNWCVPSGCTRINRPDVPTIYPPVAEALFAAVPPGHRERPMQLTMSAFAFGTAVLLWCALRRLGRDPRRAVLWAWCPLVALEAGNNAHVDVVAVGVAAAALYVLARARTGRAAALGGLLLGLAVATKLTPALLGPAVLRRRPVSVAVAAAGAITAVYLPHILAVGPAVLGYLPGYLHEEGYSNGSRFALVSLLLPAPLVAPAAVLLLVTAALYAPDRGSRPALAGRRRHGRRRAARHRTRLPVVLDAARDAHRVRRSRRMAGPRPRRHVDAARVRPRSRDVRRAARRVRRRTGRDRRRHRITTCVSVCCCSRPTLGRRPSPARGISRRSATHTSGLMITCRGGGTGTGRGTPRCRG
ncbi:hypothetical protein GCM10027610_047290 [Dactylosporangium cerinum]